MSNKTFSYNRDGGKTYSRSMSTKKIYSGTKDISYSFGDPIYNSNLNKNVELSQEKRDEIRYSQNPNLKTWEEELNKGKEKYNQELSDYNEALKKQSSYSTNSRFNILQDAKGVEQSAQKSDFMIQYEKRQQLIDNGQLTSENKALYEKLQKEDKARYESELANYNVIANKKVYNKITGKYETPAYAPVKSQSMIDYENLLKLYNDNNVDVLKNGEIKLTDKQIAEKAAQYKSGTTTTTLEEVDKKEYTPETKYKLENQMDAEGSQNSNLMLNKIKNGEYWVEGTGFLRDAFDNDIRKLNLQDKQYFIDKVYDEAIKYNKEAYKKEWSIDSGNPLIDLGGQAAVNSLKIADYVTNGNLIDDTIGATSRGYQNTKIATKVGDLIYTGKYNEAVEYLKNNPLKTGKNSMRDELLDEIKTGKTYLPAKYLNELKTGSVEGVIEGVNEQIGQMGAQVNNPLTFMTTVLGIGGGALIGGIPSGGVGAIPGAVQGGKVGLTVGNALGSARSEAGYAFIEMVNDGIDADIAKNFSMGVGVVNSAIEFAQFSKLLKFVGKSGVADKSVRYGTKELVKEYAFDLLENTAQEIGQEGVTIIGTNLAKREHNAQAKNALNQISYDSLNEITSRLIDTGTSSLITFGILQLPSLIYNTKNINTFELTDYEKRKQIKQLKTDVSNMTNYEELVVAKQGALTSLELGNFSEKEKIKVVDIFDNKIDEFEKVKQAKLVEEEAAKEKARLEQEQLDKENAEKEKNKGLSPKDLQDISYDKAVQSVMNNTDVDNTLLDFNQKKALKNLKAYLKDLTPKTLNEIKNWNVKEALFKNEKWNKSEILKAEQEFINTHKKSGTSVYSNNDILSFNSKNKDVTKATSTGKILGDLFGIEVLYTYNKDATKNKTGHQLSGDNFVVINLNKLEKSDTLMLPSEQVIGHEMFHAMKAKNPQLMKDFIAIVNRHVTPEEMAKFQAIYNSEMDPTLVPKKNMTPEEYKKAMIDKRKKVTAELSKVTPEEIAADIFSKIVSNKGDVILQMLEKQNKSFTQKFVEALTKLKDILKSIVINKSGRTAFMNDETKMINAFVRKLEKNINTLTKDSTLTTKTIKSVNNKLSEIEKVNVTDMQSDVKIETKKDETIPYVTVQDTDITLDNSPSIPKLNRLNYKKESILFGKNLLVELQNHNITKEQALLQTQAIANKYSDTDIGVEVLKSMNNINIEIYEVAMVLNLDKKDVDNLDYNKNALFASMNLNPEDLKKYHEQKMLEEKRLEEAKKQAIKEKKIEAIIKPEITEETVNVSHIRKTVETQEQKRARLKAEFELAKSKGNVVKLDSRNQEIKTTKNKVKKNLNVMFENKPELTETEKTVVGDKKIIVRTQRYDSNPKKVAEMQARINTLEKQLKYKDMRIENEKAKVTKIREKLTTSEKSHSKELVNNLRKGLIEQNRKLQAEQKEKLKLTKDKESLQKSIDETVHQTEFVNPVIADIDLDIVSNDLVMRKFNGNTAQKSQILSEANALVPLNNKIRTKYTVELVNDKVKQIKKKYSDQQIIDHLLNTNRALKPVEQGLLYDQMTTVREANDLTKSQMLMNKFMMSSSEAGLSLWFTRELHQLLPEFMVERTIDRIQGIVGDFMNSKNPKLALWASNFDINSPENQALLHNVKMYAEAIGKIDRNNPTSAIKAEKLFASMKESVDEFLPIDFRDSTVNARKISGMLTFGFGKLGRDVVSNYLQMASQGYEKAFNPLGAKIARSVTKSDYNEIATVNMFKLTTAYGKSIMNATRALPMHIGTMYRDVQKAKEMGGKKYAAKVAHLNLANLSNTLANVIDISSEVALRESLKTQNIDENTRNEMVQSMYDNTVMNLRGKTYETFLKIRHSLNEASESVTNGKIHLGNYVLPVLKYSSNILIPLLYRNPLSVAMYDAKTVGAVKSLNKMKLDGTDQLLIDAKTNEVNQMIQQAVGRTGVTLTLMILGTLLANGLSSDDEEEKKIASEINKFITSKWFESVDTLTIQGMTNTLLEPVDNPYNYIGNTVKGYGKIYLENTVFNSLLYPTKYTADYGDIAQNLAANVVVTALGSNIPSFVKEFSDIIAKYTKQPKRNIYKNSSIEEQVWYRLLQRSGIGNFWGIPIANTKFGTFDDNILNDELSSLYSKVDEKLYVNVPRTFTTDTKKYTLTASQYDTFNEILGNYNTNDFMTVIRSKEYDNMTTDTKIERLKNIQTENVKKARTDIIKMYNIKPVN